MAETRSTEREQQRTSEQQRGMTRQGEQSRGRGQMQRRQQQQGYPALLALSPFELMRRMTEDMLGTFAGPVGARAEQAIWSPRIEAFNEGNEFVIRAELPGMNADEVLVDISDDAVIIHGERREQRREDREGAIVSEIVYGEFNRVIPLPEGVIPDSAAATFRDGVLEIRMPAPSAEVRRGRRLEIGQGQEQGGAGKGRGAEAQRGGQQAQAGTQPGQSGSQGERGPSREGGGQSR